MCPRRYLIEHGAHVGAVNSEGELPLDVATEDAMERLLKEQIKKQGDGRSLADWMPVDACNSLVSSANCQEWNRIKELYRT